MPEPLQITVRVKRACPARDEAPHWVSYQLSVPAGLSVTNVLYQINTQLDGGLAYRVACRRGICASCIMRVNGRPRLACCEEVTGDLELEPAFPERVVKDLVIEQR